MIIDLDQGIRCSSDDKFEITLLDMDLTLIPLAKMTYKMAPHLHCNVISCLCIKLE